MRPDSLLPDLQELAGVVAVVRDPLVKEVANRELTRHRVRDALPEIDGLERPHELDAVVADAHELHPEALAEPLAVFARPGDLGLVPRARLLFTREDLAD